MLNWAGVPSRIKVLLGFHLLIGTAPAATYMLPLSAWLLPAMWALAAISVAQLMLLSFWVGMASNPRAARLLGSLCGTAYVTAWPFVAQLLLPQSVEDGPSLTTTYLIMFCSYYAMVILIAAAFTLIRRRGTSLRRLTATDTEAAPARIQYSVSHLLMVTSISAIVLAFLRNAKADLSANEFSEWQFVAGICLMLIVFLVNSVSAAWAALSLGPIRLRVGLVFIVAVLLGIALSVSMGHLEVSWWLLLGGSSITVFFTAIIIGSLLIVRSCGYRLVPRTLATAVK